MYIKALFFYGMFCHLKTAPFSFPNLE